MTHAKQNESRHNGWMIAGALLIAGVATAACSSNLLSDSTSSPRSNGDNESGNYAGASSSGGSSSGKEPTGVNANAGAPTGSGIVLVHAAAFPSFRLCFEKNLNRTPQPDSKIMPEANVVGVEVGSVVRIDPIDVPGKIYVINEKAIRQTPDVLCSELLGTGTAALIPDNDYHTITETDVVDPLGQNKVHVLAITGCGSQAFLNLVAGKPNADHTSCGVGWDTTSGNLHAKYLELTTTKIGATTTTVPVQLVHVAPDVDAKGGLLEVSFGTFTADTNKLTKDVANQTAFLKQADQVTLDVNQADESVYGTQGFRIQLRDGNGTATFTANQSLASVQELSSPTDIPTTYYRAASNYALLLLGDPKAQAKLDTGGPNRRAVHLLAVPVVDQATLDANADAGPPDGGAK